MTQTILIISAGKEAIPGILRAKELGLKVVASDLDPMAHGFKYADFSIIASTFDPDMTLKKAISFQKKGNKIQGVLSVGADVPLTVSKVARELNLKAISVNSAKKCIDKLLMKEVFKSNEVNVPNFYSIKSVNDICEVLKSSDKSFVLKPVDSRGSRGVLLIDKESNFRKAFNYSIDFSEKKSLILEEYIDGPQVSTESIFIDGKLFTPGFADRNYEFLEKYRPNIIENGGNSPSTLSKKIQLDIHKLVERGADALGINQGTIKGDIVVKEGMPYIIELAPRLSGGHFCSKQIPASTGVDFIGLAIKNAMGWPIYIQDVLPTKNKPVAQRYWFPPRGEVLSIPDVGNIIKNNSVNMVDIWLEPGDKVDKITHHRARGGTVIAEGETLEEAIKLCNSIIEENQILIKS